MDRFMLYQHVSPDFGETVDWHVPVKFKTCDGKLHDFGVSYHKDGMYVFEEKPGYDWGPLHRED